MTMSDYVKSIAKQGTAEWSNYDGDLKPKTDYVILAFYVDPNNEDQLKVCLLYTSPSPRDTR